MTEKLCALRCVPCEVGTPPLTPDQVVDRLSMVPLWSSVGGSSITRTFKFPNFATGLEFVNKVGELAEEQGHHPDIRLSWGKATIKLSTHKIRGLSENDFIMAAKIDELAEEP